MSSGIERSWSEPSKRETWPSGASKRLFEPRFPVTGPLGSMRHRKYLDDIVHHTIQNIKWKSLQHCATDIPGISPHFHQRELERIFSDSDGGCLEQTGEPISKPSVACGVPVAVMPNFRGSELVGSPIS